MFATVNQYSLASSAFEHLQKAAERGKAGVDPKQPSPSSSRCDATMKKVARTIKQHRDGILRWFNSKIANGLIEGINSLVQAAKAKARGYRSLRDPARSGPRAPP